MPYALTYYGDPTLRLKGAAIEHFDENLKTLVEEMFETMYIEEGIGLAAQQIGIAQQICVVDVRPPENRALQFNYRYDDKDLPLDLFMPLALINPEVEISDPTESSYQEGCLSFPGIQGQVVRPSGISCQFQDCAGQPHRLEADGLLARCILHEVDHLNGVLFIDKMERKDLQKNSTRIKQLMRLHKK